MIGLTRTLVLVLTLAAVAAAGCSTFKTKVAPPPAGTPPKPAATEGHTLPRARYRGANYFLHQVRWEGETPALVAEWYTGSAANSRQILRATPNLHGERLRPGDVLFIPAALVRTHAPLPAGLVRPPATASPPRPAAAPRKATPQQPPEPFGPRTYPDQESTKP
jgi:hypothetical protein